MIFLNPRGDILMTELPPLFDDHYVSALPWPSRKERKAAHRKANRARENIRARERSHARRPTRKYNIDHRYYG